LLLNSAIHLQCCPSLLNVELHVAERGAEPVIGTAPIELPAAVVAFGNRDTRVIAFQLHNTSHQTIDIADLLWML
jgi:hypothetical protein